jgi:hypothetical protein
LSIVYIKSIEDLYHCYKYKPTIITTTVEASYINNLNRCGPSFNDEGKLVYSCYLIRRYKGKITSYKSNNVVLVVDDKLAKSRLGFSDFSSIISSKYKLFDMVAYNHFVVLCKKWANPYKWLYELEYLENLNDNNNNNDSGSVITNKQLNLLYVNSRLDVWDYINNIGKGGANYKTILSLDSNTLWYLFIVKNVLTTVRQNNNNNAQLISYFELLKEQVIEGKLNVKFALIYLEIYLQTRERL